MLPPDRWRLPRLHPPAVSLVVASSFRWDRSAGVLEAARADGVFSCCFHRPNLPTPRERKLYRCVSELAFEWCSEIIRRTHAQVAAVSLQPPASIPSEKWMTHTQPAHDPDDRSRALSARPTPHLERAHLETALRAAVVALQLAVVLGRDRSSSRPTPPPPRAPRPGTLSAHAACREARVGRATTHTPNPGGATPTTHARAAAQSRAPTNEVIVEMAVRAALLGPSGT